MKKLLGGLLAIFTAIISIFYLFSNKSKPGELPKNEEKEDLKNEIKDIEKKEQDLKENGVKPMSPEETLKYWEKN